VLTTRIAPRRSIFIKIQNEDGCLLGCCAMSSCVNRPMFQRCLLPQSSVIHRPDDGGNKHLWNVGKFLPDNMAQRPRRQPSSYSSPWEPEISPNYEMFIHINCLSPYFDKYLQWSITCFIFFRAMLFNFFCKQCFKKVTQFWKFLR
jgi:hypothetical protein